MPAANWSDLQEYEAQFDAALASILAPFAAAPFRFTLYPQQSVEELLCPRVEYQFALGAPSGPGDSVQLRGGVSGFRCVAWNFTLLFRFVYDRRSLQSSQSSFKGALRELLAPEAQAFNSTSLPYYDICALNEVRAVRGIVGGDEKAKQRDAWESSWEGIFKIRPDAYPV